MSEAYTWPANPFPAGGIPQSTWLAGRAAELQELHQALRAPTVLSVMLRGPRGIGKTTLALRFLDEEVGAQARTIYLNVRDLVTASVGDQDGAANAIAGGIIDELAYDGLLPAHLHSSAVRTAGSLLREVLPAVCVLGQPRLIIALDDIDSLPASAQQAVWRGVQRARKLPYPPLFVALAGEDWAGGPGVALPDPEGNRSRQIRLGPLSREGTAALLRRFEQSGLFPFLPEAVIAAWDETRGYPLFLASLLDQLYERRWERQDRDPVGADEVREVARRCEIRMPERVRHALLQAGPIAVRVLRTLADENGRTIGDLERIVTTEWRAEPGEVRATLAGLRASGLLAERGSVVTFESPLLQGWVREMPSEEAEGVDRPPRPEAHALYQRAEALARDGHGNMALPLLEQAAQLDEHFWRARWLLARLRFDRARASGAAGDDLDCAIELLEALREQVPSRSSAIDAIDATYREALVLLARSLPIGHHRRRQLLEERLHPLDPALATPGANALMAEEDVAGWLRRIEQSAPERWEQATRDVLRHDRCWPGLAAALADCLGAMVEAERLDDLVRLLRATVPPLLMAEPPAGAPGRLWDVLGDTLQLLARTTRGDAPSPLSPIFFEALLLTAPPERRDALAAICEPLLLRLVVACVREGEGRGAERIARTLADIEADRLLGTTLDEVTELALGASGDLDRAAPIAAALGRYLLVVWTTGRREAETAATLALMFADDLLRMLGKQRLSLPEPAVAAWEDLARVLDGHVYPGEIDVLRRLSGRLEPIVPRAAAPSAVSDDERDWVERLLENAYQVDSRVTISIPGLSAQVLQETVRAYRAHGAVTDRERSFLVRVFHLRSSSAEVTSLLRYVWENEQRALCAISLRPDGRALTRFEDAWFREREDVAVLVTEWPGDLTLRDRLAGPREGLFDPRERWHLWGHLRALLETVNGLHRASYIHRGLRPDVVFVNDEGVIDPDVTPALKLGHFEWSVYLRGLSQFASAVARSLDRYVAPEALRSALGIHQRGQWGESFVSDIYAFGLLVFECIVRPFTAHELGFYRTPESYDAAHEIEHKVWLESLREEVLERARRDRRQDPLALTARERDILLQLLQFDLYDRPARLDELLQDFRLASIKDAGPFVAAGAPLRVLTTLAARPGYNDPRTDPECVAYFLRRHLPEIEIAAPSELEPDSLRRMLERELGGDSIEVYVNRQGSRWPVLLRGRSGILFRLQPFIWSDDLGRPKVEDRRFAYLEVARREDRPLGDALARLPRGIVVSGVIPHEVRRARQDFNADVDAAWREIFQLAERAHQARRVEETLGERDQKRRRLAAMLELSIDCEREALAEEMPYTVAKDAGRWLLQGPPGVNLAQVLARWSADDLRFEFASSDTAVGCGLVLALGPENFDATTGNVFLDALDRPIPQRGIVRPATGRATEVLYKRRRDIFRQVSDDPYLLDFLDNPQRYTKRRPLKREHEPILPELDEDKRRITRQFLEVRPLLVVQGPPGTGKTTLATELILQQLEQLRTSRILVTTQSHEPLDNLLERLDGERKDNERARALLQQIEIVRIPSGWHRQPSERVARFYPHARADEVFLRLRRWMEREIGRPSLGLAGRAATALASRIAVFQSAPDSLRRRIRDSANVVFTTTNSREIHDEKPSSYDLVIIEEAARSFPIELVGALRLARRWLLIGDHRQLPPYGEEELARVYAEKLARRRQEVEEDEVLQPAERARSLSWLEGLAQDFERHKHLFRQLHGQRDAEDRPGSHVATLRIQWRMHPVLGEMVSHVFYDGQAVCNPEQPADREALAARRTHFFTAPDWLKDQQLVWIDFDRATVIDECAENRSLSGSLDNSAERRTLVAALRRFRSPRQSSDIAILTPYREQAEQLRGLLRPEVNEFWAFGSLADRVYTVDSFQGRQAGTIILSLVRNNRAQSPIPGIGFLDRRERATVMFSRAERLLIILGCSAQFEEFADKGTRWVMEIFKRARRVDWLDLLDPAERMKIAERRGRRR